MANVRQVYVISDLHIGGAYPLHNEDRGFRMMTHPDTLTAFLQNLANRPPDPQVELVINGDFVDFLAEEHSTLQRWTSFLFDQKEAVATFRRVVERPQDRGIFEALAELVHRGHSLTVLLGNHDIELSLPDVRAAFAELLGIDGNHSYRFIYDGEGYQVGDALIEHGNRYDPANIVDHDGLRRFRSLQSRQQCEYLEGHFTPPAGSRVVAEVMNPIKADYGFIDLLKPESEPLFAFLLAIEPSYRQKLGQLAKALVTVPRHLLQEPALPSYRGDIAAREATSPKSYKADISSRESGEESALHKIIADVVGEEAANELAPPVSFKHDVAAGIPDSWMGLAKLLFRGESAGIEERLRTMRKTLSALQNDRTFDDSFEPSTRYIEAATVLARGGQRYRFVIFGHTHHAKDVQLPGGARYLNTGTWANLMRFPEDILATDDAQAMAALRSFLEDLRENRLEPYIKFRPTYVRLDLSEDGLIQEAILCEFVRDPHPCAW